MVPSELAMADTCTTWVFATCAWSWVASVVSKIAARKSGRNRFIFFKYISSNRKQMPIVDSVCMNINEITYFRIQNQNEAF
jgi:hypothetical protein